MKVSYKWLCDLVDLNGIDAYTAAERLTSTGLEVEEVKALASATNLIVGEVIECVDHPDSDHLHVTKVNIGSEVLDIVCGAKNCRKGIKVIVARIGAKLPEIEIKKSKVRGVESNGMLCSLLELGVNKKHLSEKQLAGIEILGDDAIIGDENVLAYLKLDDYILDVKPTPNRQDLLSVYGIARELAAIFKRELKLPNLIEIDNTVENNVNISKDDSVCEMFLATKLSGLKVKESPEFIKKRLEASGISSINNIVDISNYVMLELGQPLHFYDLDKFSKMEIKVEKGYETEFVALDDQSYKIAKDDIVVTSDNKIIAIAGVMGSKAMKVDFETTNILLEAAIFDATKVRNTSRRLNLLTDAATRFSKGIEHLNPLKATKRAVELLIKYADAKVITETLVKGEIKDEYSQISVKLDYINQLLGTDYNNQEVAEVLENLNFMPQYSDGCFTIKVPSYRQDIKIEQDIVEEVIRILGFERLKSSLSDGIKTIGQLSEKQKLIRSTKEFLNAAGLDEIITYTLVDEKIKDDDLFVDNDEYELLSPMSEKRRYIRESLMGSMLECASYNKARKVEKINIFEISNFTNKNSNYYRLGIYLDKIYQNSKLKKYEINGDFYTLKGIIISYLNRIGITSSRIKIEKNDIDHKHFYPYKSAKILLDNKMIGLFGHLHPNVVKKYDLNDSVYGEIQLDLIIESKKEKVKFKSLDRYPSSSRDIALVVNQEVEVREIIKLIKSSSKLVKELEIFDVYQGEHIEAGKKSVAVNVIYNGVDHTLTEEELNTAHNNILDNLFAKLKAEIRR